MQTPCWCPSEEHQHGGHKITELISHCKNERCECSHDTTGKLTWKNVQALNGIGTHDHCVTGTMLYQLSYQSHMRAVVCELSINSVDVILCPKVVGSNPVQSLKNFSGQFSSSVMVAFASFILSFNYYCWTHTMEFIYFSRVLLPQNL